MTAEDKSHDVLRRVFASAMTVFLGSGFSKLLLVIVEFYLAIVLGKYGYGLYSIGFAMIALISGLALFGFGYGTVQFLSIATETGDVTRQRSVARSASLFVFGFSALIGAVIFVAAKPIALYGFHKPDLAPILIMAGIILPFESLNQTLSAIFRGLRQFRINLLVLDIVRNLALVAYIPFMAKGVPVVSLYFAFAAGSILGSVVGVIALSRQFDLMRGWQEEWPVFKEVFSFSYLLFFWQVLQKSANGVFLLVAGAILPASDVGILAIAIRFVNLLNFAQTVFNTTTPVEFARYNHLGDHASLSRSFQLTSITLLIISFALSIPIFLNPDFIMRSFGHDYSGYGWVLLFLVTAKLTNVGSGPVGVLLIACRRRLTMMALSAGELVMQLAITIPGTLLFGLKGAVVAETGRTILLIAVRQIVLLKTMEISPITRRFLVVCLVGVAGVAAGLVVEYLNSSFEISIVATVLALAVFAGGLFLVIRKEPGFRQSLLAVLRPKRRRRKQVEDGSVGAEFEEV